MANSPSAGSITQAVRPPPFQIGTTQRRERYLKMLVYGNYGVGKTTLACSALEVPSMNDIILISAESGTLSVAEQAIDEVTVRDFRTFGAINEFLKQHCKARDEGNEEFLQQSEAKLKRVEPSDIKKPRHYNTVIIDSLSEVEAYCFNQLLGITDTTRLDDVPQSAEWTEYKQNHTMMQRVVRGFRDLPMHVIFTAGEQYTQDEAKRLKYSPDMTGKLAKKVQGFMDMVGYYVMAQSGEKIARRLYVMPSTAGKYDAKHRYAAFKGDHFEDPSIKKILTQVGLADKDGVPLK